MASLFKNKKSHKEEHQFPETLSGFGYEFNKDGKLQNSKTGEGFQFVVKEGDQAYNQRHYEALGEVVTDEIYKLLESECNLKRAPVPYDATEDDDSTFVFHSDDALSNPDKLLVLIHGSGVVRAGQWSRRLIINDSLKSGSQIPFIQEAQKEGYGILVTNTNDNYRNNRGKIKSSENPESHALHVWKHYIHGAKAKHIAIIAHSYGGCVVTSLFTRVQEEFTRRVFAVAMTDSVHYMSDTSPFKDLVKVSRNWVCSQEPLDTPVKTHSGDITRVSAGVTVHEQTSWASFTSIFKFLRERLSAVKGDVGVTCSEGGGGEDTSEATNEKSCGKGDKGGSCVTEEEEKEDAKKMRKDT
ncbi:hypothetical protein O3P69_008886 [Scylla paramamosain]|uniref:Arb2 domain-containing protein n=1 Tax=Scylla paramamosain TaxID=85552 RepID=A0AAW0TPV1_SCYPA